MAQRDLVRVAIGAAVGALVATVLVLLLKGGLGQGDRETTVTLWQEGNGPCQMTYQKFVTVKQEKRLTWRIDNHCGSAQTVALGNFRKDQQGGGSNCSTGGTATPFPGQQPASVTIPPGEDEEIKLKAKKLDSEERREEYYFDICLNGVSVDPKLIIDRE